MALKLAVVAVGLTGLLLALREQSLRMERWGPSAACLAGLALVGVVLALRWRLGLTRPFMFSFCFFGVFAGLLARFDRTEAVGPLVVLAPLQLVWANLHAGAVFGPFLVGAAFIPHLFRRPEIRGRLLGLLCACAALVAVKPDGLDAYLSLLAIGPGGGDPIVGYVVEQAPLTTLLQRADQRSTVLPGAILGAVAWVALLVVPTARCVRVAIPLVTFSLLSLLYARALGFVALAAAEPVFLLLLMISRRVAIARVWLPAASAVVFGMAVVASTAWCVDSAGENWGVGEGDDRDHPAGAERKGKGLAAVERAVEFVALGAVLIKPAGVVHDGVLAGLRRGARAKLGIDVAQPAVGGDGVLGAGHLRRGQKPGEQREVEPGAQAAEGAA